MQSGLNLETLRKVVLIIEELEAILNRPFGMLNTYHYQGLLYDAEEILTPHGFYLSGDIETKKFTLMAHGKTEGE